MEMHLNWDPVSQAKFEGDLVIARTPEMQFVGPPACGYAQALVNLDPGMGQIAPLPCGKTLDSQRL